MVICTHLHVDHVGWNTRLDSGRWVPTFPRARHLFARAEWEHWSSERDDDTRRIMADSVQPVLDAGLATLVEMDHRVSDELWLEPTPGHTPGHVSVRLRSGDGEAVITGDLMHHPVQIAEPRWGSHFDTDLEAGAEDPARLLRALRRRARHRARHPLPPSDRRSDHAPRRRLALHRGRLMELQGRAAFVTGGSGDLGAAICERLARAGCDIAVGYVGNRESAERVAGLVKGLGRRATMVQVDQADAAACEPAVSAAAARARPSRHPRQQRRLEHRHPVPRSRRAHRGRLGPPPEHEPARPVPPRQGGGAAHAQAGRGPHRQHRLDRRTAPHRQLHRLRDEQGRARPPHALPRGGAGPRHHRELRGARPHRGHAHGPAHPARGGRERAPGTVVLGRGADVGDIAAQVETFCRADSVTGQVLVVDGGLAFH